MRFTGALVALAIIWANAVSHMEFDPGAWLPDRLDVVQGNPHPERK